MKQRNILIKPIKLDHNNRQPNGKPKEQNQNNDLEDGDNLEDFLNKRAGMSNNSKENLEEANGVNGEYDDDSSSISSVDSDIGNFNIWDNSELRLRGINAEEFTDYYGKRLSFLQLFKLRSSFFAKGKRPTFKDIFKGAERVFRFCRSELSLEEFLSDENIEHSVVSLDMNSDRNFARFTSYFQDCVELNSYKMRQDRYDRYHNGLKCDSNPMNSELLAASNRHPSNFTKATASGVINGLNLSPRKAPKKGTDSVRKSQMNLHQLSQMQKKKKNEITQKQQQTQSVRQSQDFGKELDDYDNDNLDQEFDDEEPKSYNENQDQKNIKNIQQDNDDLGVSLYQQAESTAESSNICSGSLLGSIGNFALSKGVLQHGLCIPPSQSQTKLDLSTDNSGFSALMTQSQGLYSSKQQKQEPSSQNSQGGQSLQTSFRLKLQSTVQEDESPVNEGGSGSGGNNPARPKIPSGADWSPRKRLAYEQQQRENQQKQQQQQQQQNGGGSPSLFSQFIEKTALQQQSQQQQVQKDPFQSTLFNHPMLASAEFNSSSRTLFGMAKLKQQSSNSPVKAMTLNKLPELQHFQSTNQSKKNETPQQFPSLVKQKSEKQRHISTDFNRPNAFSVYQQSNGNNNNDKQNSRINTQSQQHQQAMLQAPSSLLFISQQQQQQTAGVQRLIPSPVLKGQHRKYFSQHVTSNDVKKTNLNGGFIKI